MKKVLLVNNKYRNFGGEDSNILDEIIFLKKNFLVEYLEFNNSEKLNFFDIISFLFGVNFKSNKELSKKIKSFNPDLIYVHNTWFKANIGIFNALKKEKIQVVLKIHNFRFSCTKNFFNYSHFKNSKYCSMCGNNKKKLRILNKYFEESYIKSIFIILYGKRYFKVLKDFPLRIVVLNNFYKDYMIKEGILENKISILYNPIDIPKSSNYKFESDYAIYAGLINNQKGVDELIKSWINANIKLRLIIVGKGYLLDELKIQYKKFNIEFLGFKEHNIVLDLIKNSRAVITATKLFEGQPRILLEALKYGVPSIFPNYGGMKEYFPEDYQLSFEQFNYLDLESKIKLLLDNDLLKRESIKIQNNFKNNLVEKVNFEKFFNSEIL